MSLGNILNYSFKTEPRDNIKMILRLEAENAPLNHNSVKVVQAHGFLMTDVIYLESRWITQTLEGNLLLICIVQHL